MGARRFEDLHAWQLATALRREVLAITARDPCRRDLRLCDQIRAAASSTPANIAEGFGRYAPREFARFLRIALGSLSETRNHIVDAWDRGYLQADERQMLERLCGRAGGAMLALIRYLETQGPPPSHRRSGSRNHRTR